MMPAETARESQRATAEFDRQVHTLLQRRYPAAAGASAAKFLEHVGPLRERLAGVSAAADEDPTEWSFPFVVVVTSALVPRAEAIQLVERRGRAGFSVIEAEELESFETIPAVRPPRPLAYLLVDIETGRDTRDVTPDSALAVIESRRRFPLTLDEAIALVTHHPEAVARNRGFSLLGSRCGDRRVTAVWISDGRPKLGWCWAGNPHTWLGSASCAGRIGP
jgi:Family of unknown function (DUF5701)